VAFSVGAYLSLPFDFGEGDYLKTLIDMFQKARVGGTAFTSDFRKVSVNLLVVFLNSVKLVS
jgi:hypothetical protein